MPAAEPAPGASSHGRDASAAGVAIDRASPPGAKFPSHGTISPRAHNSLVTGTLTGNAPRRANAQMQESPAPQRFPETRQTQSRRRTGNNRESCIRTRRISAGRTPPMRSRRHTGRKRQKSGPSTGFRRSCNGRMYPICSFWSIFVSFLFRPHPKICRARAARPPDRDRAAWARRPGARKSAACLRLPREERRRQRHHRPATRAGRPIETGARRRAVPVPGSCRRSRRDRISLR